MSIFLQTPCFSKVLPWSPAHGLLNVGDQILEIEGHWDCEITDQEAESLAALKANYLRLGVKRPQMFSNQYMGTRLASRSLPRTVSTTTYNVPGPYMRMNSSDGPQKPVNARLESTQPEEEEVDYSFMSLPVRERRKLFLGGTGVDYEYKPRRFHSAGARRSMTMPRPRLASQQPTSTARFDTQSEYGGGTGVQVGREDSFCWEPSITPNWSRGVRSAPNLGARKSSTTGTIVLNNSRFVRQQQQSFEVPGRQQPYYAPPAQYSPERNEYSTTLRVHDPYAYDTSPTRVVSNSGTRIYPTRRYNSVVGTPRTTYGYTFVDPWKSPATTVSGRVSQPLRVNVYNSDASSVYQSPVSKTEGASWGVNSPVYPAYPAHMVRSYNAETQENDRFRRGQSVQPARVYTQPVSPVVQRQEVQQSWRPLQVSGWKESSQESPRRGGRVISVTKPIAVRQNPPETNVQVGSSDF
ncbi:uncharacterized protein DEA37_0004403 [Paragonimus westermani]|uniref:PDZ domain-containing protein n=1 Tax=Paragonimus westermani TaxID=34504 RepID=A0A5J4NYY1_9TREM|nr:uncharacterized protein DEA37_0004403 [Paragonimus westermani]